jgi:hypothetical protein
MTFDPSWISLSLTAVLSLVTLIYVIFTGRLVKFAKLTLFYQRQPRLLVKFENKGNEIFFQIENNIKGISPASNINSVLNIRLNGKIIGIGNYNIEGTLLPGEVDNQNLTQKIIKILLNQDILESRQGEDVDTDDEGYPYFPIYYDLKKKRQVKFELEVITRYEIDLKLKKEKQNKMVRVFEVELNEIIDEPPYSEHDMYTINLRRKTGKWL